MGKLLRFPAPGTPAALAALAAREAALGLSGGAVDAVAEAVAAALAEEPPPVIPTLAPTRPHQDWPAWESWPWTRLVEFKRCSEPEAHIAASAWEYRLMDRRYVCKLCFPLALDVGVGRRVASLTAEDVIDPLHDVCWACGTCGWWQRPDWPSGRWLCQTCHPDPDTLGAEQRQDARAGRGTEGEVSA